MNFKFLKDEVERKKIVLNEDDKLDKTDIMKENDEETGEESDEIIDVAQTNCWFCFCFFFLLGFKVSFIWLFKETKWEMV